MLARSTSQANVCLRCQFRLSSRPRLSRRLYTTGPEDNDDGAPNQQVPIVRYRGGRLSSDLGKKLDQRLGRLWGRPGEQLREHIAQLEIKALGKPGEVIVLKDAGLDTLPQQEHLLSASAEEEAREHVDILAKLAKERGLIGANEVDENIEDHRPTNPEEPLSEKAIHQLAKQLQSGFTIPQLSRYIERQEKIRGLVSEVQTPTKDKCPQGKSVLRRSGWMPGRSESGAYFIENPMRGYKPEELVFEGKRITPTTRKYLLALRIIRECWQVDAYDVVEDLGEIELYIEPVKFELLLSGTKPPLEAISSRLDPNQDEKIEAFRSRHAVRITATRDNALNIVSAVEDELLGVQCLEVDVDRLMAHGDGKKYRRARKHKKALLEEEIISEVARITETEIVTHPEKGSISIYCIDKKPGSGLSSRAHVAQRLILDFLRSSARIEKHLGCNLSRPISDFGISKDEELSSLSWRDKLRGWVRWTAAISKSPSDESEQSASGTAEPAHEIKLSKAFEEYSSSDAAQETGALGSLWSPEKSVESSIQLGRVLHGWPSDATFTRLQARGFNSNGFRAFSSEVQNLSQFLGNRKIDVESKSVSLRMHFMPSPLNDNVLEAPHAFPPVELHLDVDEESHDLSLAGVMAIKKSVVTDVMLPERTMDLRFQQRNLSYLRAVDGGLLPSIATFLDSSELNLKRGQLVTPPTLSLPVTKALGTTDVDPSESEDATEVEYLFAGLEYRNTISIPFRGWTLSYTSIEGGKAGGSRAELCLRPRRSDIAADSSLETTNNDTLTSDQARNFIETAYDLVNDLEAGSITWSGSGFNGALLNVDGVRYFDITTGAPSKSVAGPFKYFCEPLQLERDIMEEVEEVEELEELGDFEDISPESVQDLDKTISEAIQEAGDSTEASEARAVEGDTLEAQTEGEGERTKE